LNEGLALLLLVAAAAGDPLGEGVERLLICHGWADASRFSPPAMAITKLAEKVGIAGVSSHSFRRSALTAAHQAGLSLREVAEISGHRSLAALERYLDQDAAREKAEAARSLLVG
jgi:integrase